MSTKHTPFEDLQAMVTATALVSLGVFLLNFAGLLAGGTTGLALLLQKLTGVTFGVLFVALNLPFFYLALKQMGWQFTLKTFASIIMVALATEFLSRVIRVESANPLYCAVMGGLLIGCGLLILFRHQASLGGFNILALYMQNRYGISAGKFQMGLDGGIVVASFFVVTPWVLLVSMIGAVAVNLAIAVNHKPGRYVTS
ncbi:YitT family protein [Aestuariirhabdus litorea]|uniref:YitT family protein n=1 Tax=Aestuariirhabdus litorea TaxID=2528527 RepID=A0A3P3VTE5_9GAMM|nr:YitT family protein [Aestuariirhabdus litorea]RRJ84033.1 YitT family protein [Aestuariirhabdus litorea]RWW97254.1 YitT family protein [Endozoicomonadaceae bacterium GTF-13]